MQRIIPSYDEDLCDAEMDARQTSLQTAAMEALKLI
jgi:hypothetical protein